MRNHIADSRGFTLIEIVIVIMVIGVLGTVATLRLKESVDTAKFEQTKKELDQLAMAIAGNPGVYTNGARSDFGFVGDNGRLPVTLDQLVQNPGWSTWDGPYMNTGLSTDDYKKDGWNITYTYTDTLIRSTGSGSNIDKLIAASSADLLTNTVAGIVVDASLQPPGTGYADSLRVQLIYPNGAGSLITSTVTPDAHGRFIYASVPIGNRILRVIHLPATDTMSYQVSVCPGRDVNLEIIFPADLW
jgi:prepilin-type N-terminal cleavage/methylation domain-containing protein